MIKAIAKHQNYFFTTSGDKCLYGLEEDFITGAIEIINQDGEPKILNDFFTKDEDLYFTIQNYDSSGIEEGPVPNEIYYKQDKNGKVSELKTKPDRPELIRSQLENGEFSIKTVVHEKNTCSDVNNETIKDIGFERFLLVNGFSYFPSAGLFFNIVKGRPKVRRPGLAWWPVGSTQYKYVQVPQGEIW